MSVARSRSESIEALIAALNSLGVGQLGSIETRLAAALRELAALGVPELVGVLEEARIALSRGDLANFRRLVAQTVARLGHLR